MNSSEEYSRAMREKRITELELEIVNLKTRIAELEHQHRDDEFANRLLLSEIERLKNAI